MSRTQILAALLGAAAAALFIRLGVWQLDRWRFVRLANDLKIARLAAPPSSPFGLPYATRRWRRVTVTGTFDFDHQVVLAGRSNEGSPGVDLITPLTPDGGGRPILVDRGWVYSADAQTVTVAKFDEPPHTTITGYVEEFTMRSEGSARTASTPNGWRWLQYPEIDGAFPFAIAPFYIVAQPDSGVGQSPDAPVRHPLPSLDEGPHKVYAIQWFTFALIALVGSSIVIGKEQQLRRGGNP